MRATNSGSIGIAVVSQGALGLLAVLFVSSAMAGPSVTAGRELYETNGCVNCHGRTGRGDGPAARSLPAKPADLRDPSQFKKGSTEAAIAKTLEQGIEIEHLEPGQKTPHHMLAMPKFDHLSKTERRSIALYVLSLGKTSN
jgi:high-affinity iron transporter